MKLLLDENLPHQLRHEIAGHSVFTTAFMGWSGIENGELLRPAAADGFDAVITNDRGLEYEQNPVELPLAVVVLMSRANNIEAIRPLYPKLIEVLRGIEPKKLVKVDVTEAI